MEILLQSQTELTDFGQRLGAIIRDAAVIELVGDVGAGKTTLVAAIAKGLGIEATVSSPSYTLSQVYDIADGRRLVHYDFYRLDNPGIMAQELAEALSEGDTVVAVEWAGIVDDVLPADHLRIEIIPTDVTARKLHLTAGGSASRAILEQLA